MRKGDVSADCIAGFVDGWFPTRVLVALSRVIWRMGVVRVGPGGWVWGSILHGDSWHREPSLSGSS
jgi:hypothetical protein